MTMKTLKILALVLFAAALLPSAAEAKVPPRVHHFVSFLNGANLNTLKIDGTEVTSTPAELNILDGATLSLAELNILTGVTATAAQLNFNVVTAGTLTASKALVADASSQIDIVDVTGSLKIDGNPAIQCETVVIATGELLALAATPKVLVAAPGANLFIAVQSVTLALDYATTAYDGVAAGEDLSIQYVGGAVKVTQDVETTGFLDQANDELRFINGAPQALAAAAAADPLVPTVNAGVDITLLTGEIATGDSPLDVRICYSVQPDLLD
jgi:hypothetical protein